VVAVGVELGIEVEDVVCSVVDVDVDVVVVVAVRVVVPEGESVMVLQGPSFLESYTQRKGQENTGNRKEACGLAVCGRKLLN
jgi:hypothetical protein